MWNLLRSKSEPKDKSYAALSESQARLQITKARTPEVEAITKSLRMVREHNHFAEQLNVIMGGPYGK